MTDNAGSDHNPLPASGLRPVARQRFPTFRAIMALILREMSTTYGRSPGGYVWAILEPALGVALLTAIFSIGFRSPPLGTNFPLFYATGILPFLMFNELSGKMSQVITFSRALLSYPRVTFIDALVARLALGVFTQMMVHMIMISAILIYFETHTTQDFSKIALAYFMLVSLAIGIGTLNCVLFQFFPAWQSTWSILTRPLFLISCVIFIFEAVPRPYSDILWFNPLVHVVGMMRDGFYPFYQPTYVSVIFVMTVAGICCALGLFLLHRYHRDLLEI